MAFPTSPSNNQVHKEGNRTFVYDSALGTWDQVRETDRTENKVLSGELSGAVIKTLTEKDTFPPGHIIQTKTGVYSTSKEMNFDTNTWNSVGLSVTITPKYANSKILVSWCCNVFAHHNDGNFGMGFRIGRHNGSEGTNVWTNVWSTGQIGAYHYGSSYRAGNHQLVDTFAGNAIDLPASTAPVAYTALVNDNVCSYATAQYSSAPTTITVQEIKV